MTPSFDTTKKETQIIRRIVTRAIALAARYGDTIDEMSTHMDVAACHCSGNPLNLEKLLAADDFSFAHDVFGITRHIDRSTGQLMNCFSPRCSTPAEVAA